MADQKHYIYVLLCSDSSLYTGYALDVGKRMAEHREGKGSKYVRAKLPIRLLHSEIFETKSEALKREIEIKSWTREEKIENLGLRL